VPIRYGGVTRLLAIHRYALALEHDCGEAVQPAERGNDRGKSTAGRL
jgi:hypothetical protein